jgi:hypothetical protein
MGKNHTTCAVPWRQTYLKPKRANNRKREEYSAVCHEAYVLELIRTDVTEKRKDGVGFRIACRHRCVRTLEFDYAAAARSEDDSRLV